MLDTSARRVNGIDLAALDALAAATRQDPRRGRVGFRVRTDWAGGMRSETIIDDYSMAGDEMPRNFTIVADQPLELFGRNGAPNPQELLMAALNACMVVGYAVQAAARGVTLDTCTIEAEGELELRGLCGLDPDAPSGYRRLDYKVKLTGDGTREQYEEIHRAVTATSPNHFSLAQAVELRGTLA